MKILFLTDNFPPESNAPASRTHEHALRWVAAGHSVTVITTAPNFPDGKVFAGYRNRAYQVEQIDGIRVVRVWSYLAANAGFAKRTLDYLSFMASGAIAALREPRPDVIVTTSPQFFCAVAGWIVSGLRRIPWVFELRDLWPESIAAVGAMKPGRLLRALERLELRMYRDADRVVSLTHAFRANLVGRGIDPAKIVVIPNGVDPERFRPMPKDPGLLEALDLAGKFVVGYLGTHGMAHALERVVDAAELLRAREDIVFVFAGSGARRDAIEALVAQRGLANVRMLAAQPKSAMPKLWSIQDLALIPLRDDPLFGTVLPSKMFEAMGMGIPILMSLPEGEATRLLRDTGAGVTVPPEDSAAMASAIVALADDRARHLALAVSARTAAGRFTRARLAHAMLDELTSVARARPSGVISPRAPE